MHHSIKGALRGLPLLILGVLVSCVDATELSSTSGTSMYVFDAKDGATSRVLVWDALDARVTEASPSPTRALSSDYFEKVKDLAWGGMVVDEANGRLYLVSKTGDVVRVDKIRTKNGPITDKLEIVAFTLGDSASRLNGGHFEQASYDYTTNTLYVMETSDSASRVWKIANPNQFLEGSKVDPTAVPGVGINDKGGTGLAAGNGQVYAYYQDGDAVITPGNERLTGPRLRKGSADGFSATGNVLAGSATTLAKYGVLAFNSTNNRVFVGRHLQDAGVTGAPILLYGTGDFLPGFNVSPTMTFGTADMNTIRTLATSPRKDWLVAGWNSAATTGGNSAFVWQNPVANKTAITFSLGSAVQARAIALDGNN